MIDKLNQEINIGDQMIFQLESQWKFMKFKKLDKI